MLHEMPCSIFDEWYEHFLDEPFGYDSDLHRHSVVCAILGNGLLRPKNNPFKCSDFHYPPKEKEYKPMSDEEMLKGLKRTYR